MSHRLVPSVLLGCASTFLFAAPGILSEVQHAPPAKSTSPDTSCLYDFERGTVPDCMRESANGELFVSQRVLKQLRFDSHGLAAVRSAANGWMYVSRTGKVVISGVPTMDNWADTFHDGLVRIVRNGKYGFSNRTGELVIAAVYDGAMNFEGRKAKVCKGCTNKCIDRDCEYHGFSGGEWLEIDTKGNVISHVPAED
jgi:hypothetical protein